MRNYSCWHDRKHLFLHSPAGLSVTHAQCPIPIRMNCGSIRFYYSSRDQEGRTRPFFVDFDQDLRRIEESIPANPLLDLGSPGSFDDSGVMPSCIVDHNGRKFMYYIGWNTGVTVPYRNAIGIAVKSSTEEKWQRLFDGPVLDRGPEDPFFCATPYIIIEGGVWRMWYLSCVEWRFVSSRYEPRYVLKYAESSDGVCWRRHKGECVQPTHKDEAIARPWVLRYGGIYRMWFCCRSIHNYRSCSSKSYRIGYAESNDGFEWKRKDEAMGLLPSEQEWDSEMTAYPAVIREGESYRMFYNGNGFGRFGFGTCVTRVD